MDFQFVICDLKLYSRFCFMTDRGRVNKDNPQKQYFYNDVGSLFDVSSIFSIRQFFGLKNGDAISDSLAFGILLVSEEDYGKATKAVKGNKVIVFLTQRDTFISHSQMKVSELVSVLFNKALIKFGCVDAAFISAMSMAHPLRNGQHEFLRMKTSAAVLSVTKPWERETPPLVTETVIAFY